MSVPNKQLRAIDFFCGGGGMTHGFLKAGVDVVAGIDIEGKCRETYEFNNKPAKFIEADITVFEPESLAEITNICKDDDNLVFIGCSPCQFWSIIKTDKKKAERSKNLLFDFQKFIDFFRPGFIVVENVPGILSHPDSPLTRFVSFLSETGYSSIEHRIVKVSDYGVPQGRKRFVLIASRTRTLTFPRAEPNKALTVRNVIGDFRVFPPINAGHVDSSSFDHTASGLTEISLKRIKLTPHDGGSRESWKDTDLQIEVYRNKESDKNFGFRDVYGRMSWDRVAPTITTKFYGISHGRFGHPEQDRAISIREGAALQTFPSDYVFKPKAICDKARLIGNAVPPELAMRIAKALLM